MKIYTKTGDDGTTGLFGNARVRKDDARIEAYGTVDEVNAAIGVLIAHLPPGTQSARGWLDSIQSDLFTVGTLLATPPAGAAPPRTSLDDDRTPFLEDTIDQMEKALKPLKNFILPQGVPAAAFAQVSRAISRRAERRTVALAAIEPVDPKVLIYLNRLSDWLFVLARWINAQAGGTETAWIPAKGSAAETGPQPDRLAATLQKIETDKQKRKTLFEMTSSEMQKRKETAERIFKQNVDQINKEGGKVEKPIRDLDLD
jgi:cob(I)alamin adenosyltransferase